MKCFNCGKENPDGIDFCTECGQKLTAADRANPIPDDEQASAQAEGRENSQPAEQTNGANMYCPSCGAKLFSGSEFCSECGNPVNGAYSGNGAPAPATKKSRGHIAAWIIGIAAAVAVIFAIGAFFMPSGGKIEGTWRQETATGLDIFGSTYMTFDDDTVQYDNTFNRQTWNYKYFPVVNILAISDNNGNRAVWHIKWNGKDEFYIKENNLTFKRYYSESDSGIDDDFDDFFDDFFDDIPDTYDGSGSDGGSSL